jgi:hypothetical protein
MINAHPQRGGEGQRSPVFAFGYAVAGRSEVGYQNGKSKRQKSADYTD